MDTLLDPSDLTGDEDTGEPLAKASRMRKLAEILRKQAAQGQQGGWQAPGQMVGKHFVAMPTQAMLLPAVQQIQAAVKDNQADAQTKQAQVLKQALQQKFLQGIPQDNPGMPALPERQQQGPSDPDAGIQAPGMAPPQAATAPTPVSRAQVLKYALQGMANPATAGIAKAYGDSTTKVMDAQDARDDKNEAAAQARLDRGEQMELNRQNQLAMLKERMDQQRAAGQDSNETKRQIAALTAQVGMDRNQAIRDAAQIRADAKAAGDANKPAKPIPTAVHKEMTGLDSAQHNLSQLQETFKPEYSGFGQGVKNALDPLNPFGKSSDAVQWWKDYNKRSSLEEAHRLFGSAFTDAEQARWNAADISPNMNAATIKENLAKRAKQARELYNKRIRQYSTSGYPNIADTYMPTEEPPSMSDDDILNKYGPKK
jgi:hypothetical protein